MRDGYQSAGEFINSQDDVGALFQTLGMHDHDFQDFSREKLASDAQKKWTLLDAVPISKQVAKPASSELKIPSERETGADSREVVLSGTAAFFLSSKKFDLSEHEAAGRWALDQPVSPRIEERRAEVQQPSLPVARTSSLFAQKTGAQPKPRSIPMTSDGKQGGGLRSEKGLFSGLDEASFRQPELVATAMDGVSEDVSLAGVFLRLEQAASKPQDLSAHSRFFIRLGRKCM